MADLRATAAQVPVAITMRTEETVELAAGLAPNEADPETATEIRGKEAAFFTAKDMTSRTRRRARRAVNALEREIQAGSASGRQLGAPRTPPWRSAA